MQRLSVSVGLCGLQKHESRPSNIKQFSAMPIPISFLGSNLHRFQAYFRTLFIIIQPLGNRTATDWSNIGGSSTLEAFQVYTAGHQRRDNDAATTPSLPHLLLFQAPRDSHLVPISRPVALPASISSRLEIATGLAEQLVRPTLRPA